MVFGLTRLELYLCKAAQNVTEEGWRMNQHYIEELLNYIPSEDRIICLKIASALKNEFGEVGFPMFQSFCRTAENYEDSWVRANRKSADPSKAFAGLIYHLAEASGNSNLDLSIQKKLSSAPPNNTREVVIAENIWKRNCTDDKIVGGHSYAITKEISWVPGVLEVRDV